MLQALAALLLLVLVVYVFGVVRDYVSAHWVFFVSAFWLLAIAAAARTGLWIYRFYQRYSSDQQTDPGPQVKSSLERSGAAMPSARKPANVPKVSIQVRSVSFRDFLKPIPDQLKKPIKGRSSAAGEFYNIYLAEQTCTCANWQTERCRYVIGDIRRLCKHMVRLYEKHDLFKDDIRWLTQHGLLPLWSGPYCAAEITTQGRTFRALRHEGKRTAQVVAPTGWKNRPEGCFSMFVEDFRWCREWPPSSTWLKPAFVTWLRSSGSSVFSEDPARPAEAIEARRYFDELERKEAEQTAALSTCCFNCGAQMMALGLAPKHNIPCPKCKAVNYVAGNGSLHNAERIALYAHYDGNYDDQTLVGVVPATLARQESELQRLDAVRKSGFLTDDQYRTNKSQSKAAHKQELEALSLEKAAALDKIKEREKAIKPVSSQS